ncbi:MAG: hypothetical protein Q7T56_00265 [Nocardioidaceae bacterium]|nr:hypothetical protein [Nocardioidaceae bacterium]
MDRTREVERPVDHAPEGQAPPVVDWPTEPAAAHPAPPPRQTGAPAGWAALGRKPVAIALAGAVLAATTFLGGFAVGRTTGGDGAATQQGGFGGSGFGGPQQGGPGNQQGQGTVPNQQGQGAVPNQQQGGTTTS